MLPIARRVVSFVAVASIWAAACAVQASSAEPAAIAPVVAARPERPQAAPQYSLVYKFVPDQQVHFLLETEAAVETQKSGYAATNHNKSTTERHFRVSSVEPDGSAHLELTIDRVKLTYWFDDNPATTYDTGAGDIPPRGFERVKDSVGKPLGRMKLSRQGKLLDLAGATSSQPVDESQNFLIVVPDKPVRIGETWSDDIHPRLSFSRTLTQKITLRRIYTLESVTGNLATIRMATAEVTPVSDPMLRGQMLQLTPEGKIVFDIDRGMIVAREQGVDASATDALGPGSIMRAKSTFNEKLVAK